MKLSEILKKLRISKGYSQGDVADYLQVNRASYSNYEQGRRDPDYQTIKKIADFYSVSTDLLLGRKDNKEMAKELSALKPDIVFKSKSHEEIFKKMNSLDEDDIYLVKGYVDKLVERNLELREIQNKKYYKDESKIRND